MRINKLLCCFAAAFAIAAAIASSAQAATLFFSPVGPPVLSDPSDPFSPFVAPQPVVIGAVPAINAIVGEPTTLHVWLKPNNLPPAQVFSAVSLDVQASNANLHATSYDVFNPIDRDLLQPRWAATLVDGLNTSGNVLVANAAGLKVATLGIGNSNIGFVNDPGRDSVSRAFYVGTFTFTPDTVGVTGLYFRNGRFRNLTLPENDGAPIQFGGDATVYQGDVIGAGDPITPDLAFADAIVTVGVPEPSTFILAAVATASIVGVRLRLRTKSKQPDEARRQQV